MKKCFVLIALAISLGLLTASPLFTQTQWAIPILDPPDQLTAQDYLGPDGTGDQGEYILLTFDRSTDHRTLTSYRIWREVKPIYIFDPDTGEEVVWDDQPKAFIPWAMINAVPEVGGLIRVIVPALDNLSTNWAISAERRPTNIGGLFLTIDKAMVAIITPQALAFMTNHGINLASDPTITSSPLAYTQEPVQAIDNIPPEPIGLLDTKALLDLQAIVVRWQPSDSDKPLAIANPYGFMTNNLVPGVTHYKIYRTGSLEPTSRAVDWELIGDVPAGDSVFVDETIQSGVWYRYRVGASDEDNTVYTDMDLFSIFYHPIRPADIATLPTNFTLHDNYPNPFNPETMISYDLPEAADVRLEIYNVMGQVVRTLVDRRQDAGRYAVQWDAKSADGQSVASGAYFYRIQVGDFREVKKMLLLR